MLAAGLIIKSSGTFLELFLPGILSNIIDVLVPLKDQGGILKGAGLMILLSFLAWRMNIAANRNASKVAENVTRSIRHDLFEHTLYLSAKKTDEFSVPSLESRLTSDTYYVHRMISMAQRMGIRAPIITVGGLIMAFVMDPFLASVFAAVIPLMGVMIWFRAAKGIPAFDAVQKKADRMTAVVRENASGIRVIKALSRTEYEKKRFSGINHDLRKQEIRANRRMAVINPMMNLFLYLGMIGVILLGTVRVMQGKSEIGKMLAFMSYFQLISRSLMAAGRMFIMFSRGIASSRRIMEVLNTENEKDIVIQECPEGDPSAVIEFDHVSFSYLKVRDNVSDISFKLGRGQKLGITGATGSGKSTLLYLLMRFYDPDTGDIYLEGKNLKSMTPGQIRSRFGVVMQNDFIFNGTAGENIAFEREMTKEEIEQAAENAMAGFLLESEEGTEYHLESRGANLSGGQKQRVLIARALAGSRQFLLLDDSSSALDYKTDAQLRRSLEENYPDLATVIVAQRISSVMNCDQIIVMDHGRISGIGTHEELLKENELYREIHESQMGGALFE